jgi:hypothetical protein
LNIDCFVDVNYAGLVAFFYDSLDEFHGVLWFIEPLAGEGGKSAFKLILPPFVDNFDFMELVETVLQGDVYGIFVEGELLFFLFSEHLLLWQSLYYKNDIQSDRRL